MVNMLTTLLHVKTTLHQPSFGHADVGSNYPGVTKILSFHLSYLFPFLIGYFMFILFVGQSELMTCYCIILLLL